MMVDNNRLSLERIIRNALPGGVTRILVGVSGGVDSVVLLHLLRAVGQGGGLELHVAHLDHGLRRESRSDAAFVSDLCGRLGLPGHFERVDVAALASEEKVSLEMAGRMARQHFLLKTAKRVGAQLIALAHHRDDQAETFMLRLARGSGLSGLACMRERRGYWWRPLLEASRKQLESFAEQAGLSWVEDCSNQDVIFNRNLIRHQVLPRLRDINPQCNARIADTVSRIQLEEDFWQHQVKEKMASVLLSSHDGVRMCRSGLLGIHPALRLRIYRQIITQVRGDLKGVEAVHLEAMDRLLTGSRSQSQADFPGFWGARRYETLWLRKATPVRPSQVEIILPCPGALTLPDGDRIEVSLNAEAVGESDDAVEFGLAHLSLPLTVRSWQPGDAFVPSGMEGHKKLKRYFSDTRVEMEKRAASLVVTSAGRIIWVVGMRRSTHAQVCSDGSAVLRLELLRSAKKSGQIT